MTPEIRYDATVDEYQLGCDDNGTFVVFVSIPGDVYRTLTGKTTSP